MSERKWKSKVCAHHIMKNEEKVLARCLESMAGWADEVYIVDTGSTDRSIEIAKEHGVFVKEEEWIDDFGYSRNQSLDFLYENCPDVDWVVWSDIDDVLMSKDDVIKFREVLDQYLDDPNVQAINMPYIYSHEKSCTGNEGIANFRYYRLRAFKKGFGKWKCRVHEYIESDATKHLNTDAVTFHHYREETLGVINTARNLRILKKVWEEASEHEKPRYSFYLAKEYTYNGMHDEAIEMFKTYLPISLWLPEKIRALYELGECYFVKKDITEATKWAFEAIKVDNRYAEPYLLLCRIAYEAKDWNMAVAWASMVPFLGKPETHFFDYLPSHTYLPWDYMQAAYYYVGNTPKAKECLDKCLSYKPHERRYLKNWAIFHHDEIEKIGIIIPTHSRKEKLVNCINKIKENAFITNYNILIGVDGNKEYYDEIADIYKDDPCITGILFGEYYNNQTDDSVEPDGYNRVGVPTIVEGLVYEAERLGCKYVTYLGDDTEPLPGFLIYAHLACEGKYLVAYNDRVTTGECQHWFSPINLKDQLGGFFFYKGYNHVGCDNELMEKAKRKGLFKFEEKALVDHVHYIKAICSDKNKVAEEDECYKLAWNEESVKKDREVLKIRKTNNFIADTEEIKIDVGSGFVKHEGYLTLDKYCEADIKADILDKNLFVNETIDRFLCEHVLEHFTKYEGEWLVQVFYNALKVGGEVEISVPDMGRLNEIQDESYKLKVQYGWQCGPGHFHKYGYNKSTLQELMMKYKFNIVSIIETFEYDAPAIRIICKK